MRTSMLDTKPITPGTCEWCGKDCELEDTACSLSCEAQLLRLEATQGRMVLRTLKLWRKHRGRKDTPGQGAMTEVAQVVDRFLRTDRERREEMASQRRQKAADALAIAETAKTLKGKKAPPAPQQTAAPLTDQPDGPLENHE